MEWIGGIISLIEGITVLSIGGLAGGSVFGAFFGAMAIPLVIIGFIYLIIGWGLWTLQGWARIVAIIFAIIGLLGFPIGTIISIIILWYLFKPEIKAAFE